MKRPNCTNAFVVMAGALALAGCEAQETAEDPSATATGTAAQTAEQNTDETQTGTLVCDDGSTIVATYRDDLGPDGGVDLAINGKTYQLYLVPSGSGSKYSTEQGLTPDMLLVYWEKDDEAMLIESPLDDSATDDDEVIRARCNVANPGK